MELKRNNKKKSRALLIFGAQDNRVSLQETQNIYFNFKGDKTLKIYPEAGHDVFSPLTQKKWAKDVNEFLSDSDKNHS